MRNLLSVGVDKEFEGMSWLWGVRTSVYVVA
jgi:hypothetical protein